MTLNESHEIEQAEANNSSISSQNESPAIIGPDAIEQKTTKQVKAGDNQSSFKFAGFWMRFWAYLLDLIVIGSIERLLIKPIFRLLDIPLSEFNMFAPISIATAIIFYAYFILMTRYFNQTLGKMVFGLKVIDLEGKKLTWGTVIFREWIGRFISATIVIGYIIVAFLPKKQGLHDLFSDTSVVHEK